MTSTPTIQLADVPDLCPLGVAASLTAAAVVPEDYFPMKSRARDGTEVQQVSARNLVRKSHVVTLLQLVNASKVSALSLLTRAPVWALGGEVELDELSQYGLTHDGFRQYCSELAIALVEVRPAEPERAMTPGDYLAEHERLTKTVENPTKRLSELTGKSDGWVRRMLRKARAEVAPAKPLDLSQVWATRAVKKPPKKR